MSHINDVTVENVERRRSERILQQLLVRVSWKDTRGKDVKVSTRTEDVSRYGAKVLLKQELSVGQQVNIYCLISEREGQARVVGLTQQQAKTYFYGVEFLDRENNLWNIPFRLFFDSLEGN